ncbi:hypothetical protein GCM10009700_35190 [Brevibacterium sanguinis]|uniref:hypothetical protein n=1 Tax=Brevibacterium sanguinis TaxID=232444 RepID=UPI0031D8EA0D
MANTVSGKTGITGASSVISGAAVAPLVIWILAMFGVDVPADVAAIIGGLLAAGGATLIAWLVPAKSGKYVDTTPWDVDVTDDGETEGDGFAPDPDVDADWDPARDGSMADFADTGKVS